MQPLIIEDEPGLLDSLAQALREEGYAGDTAEDGLGGHAFLGKSLAPL